MIKLSTVGIGKVWNESTAKTQSLKLQEMGYYAKIIKLSENHHVVVYSPKSFTMEQALKKLAQTPVED